MREQRHCAVLCIDTHCTVHTASDALHAALDKLDVLSKARCAGHVLIAAQGNACMPYVSSVSASVHATLSPLRAAERFFDLSTIHVTQPWKLRLSLAIAMCFNAGEFFHILCMRSITMTHACTSEALLYAHTHTRTDRQGRICSSAG